MLHLVNISSFLVGLQVETVTHICTELKKNRFVKDFRTLINVDVFKMFLRMPASFMLFNFIWFLGIENSEAKMQTLRVIQLSTLKILQYMSYLRFYFFHGLVNYFSF